MTDLWVIVRTEIVDEQNPERTEDPTVCGIYESRKDAVEEVLKLHIEDDIDIGSPEWMGLTGGNGGGNGNGEGNGEGNEEPTKPTEDLTIYKPTPEFINERRVWLLADAVMNNNTYTYRGNQYTIVRCVLGAKHDFDDDVMELYNKSVK